MSAGVAEQPLSRNLERFRGVLVFKAHRMLCHETLVSRVIKKKKKALHPKPEILKSIHTAVPIDRHTNPETPSPKRLTLHWTLHPESYSLNYTP